MESPISLGPVGAGSCRWRGGRAPEQAGGGLGWRPGAGGWIAGPTHRHQVGTSNALTALLGPKGTGCPWTGRRWGRGAWAGGWGGGKLLCSLVSQPLKVGPTPAVWGEPTSEGTGLCRVTPAEACSQGFLQFVWPPMSSHTLPHGFGGLFKTIYSRHCSADPWISLLHTRRAARCTLYSAVTAAPIPQAFPGS